MAEKKRVEEQKLGKVRARDYQVWLQLTFAAVVADRCISMLKDMPTNRKEIFEKRVVSMLKTQEFDRFLFLPKLWNSDKLYQLHVGRRFGV